MSSVVNSSSTPLAGNAEFPGAWEFLTVDKHGVEVVCSTDAPGNLVIEFSQNKVDINYTHTFTIEADVSFSRAVSKKGNYYRVSLVNGPSAQTTLQLVSIIQTTYQPDTLDVILDAATSSITIYGQDGDGTKRVVKTTTDGSLVVSGGGSGGGDATAANQVASNTAVCARLDSANLTIISSNLAVCQRLDTIDISANNMEVQLDKLTFTTGNLHVRDDRTLTELQGSNLAINTKLGLIADAAEDTLISVDGINAKLNALQLQSAKYTIEAVPSFAPDTVPAFTFPAAGIAKDEGWYYKNLVNGQVSQLYFYSYLNPAMAVANRQFAYQLNDITMSYCVVRLIAVNSGEGLPTLAIYTRPQGSGDAVPGFIRSRKVYNIPTSAKLSQGMEVMLYWGSVEPSLKLHPDVARIQLQLVSTIGPALGTEQLAFLSLNTDSAALAGNAEYVVSHAGFQYGAELIMDTQFTGESSSQSVGGDASATNQLASNTAICARLDSANLTITNSNLALTNGLTTLSSNIGQLYYTGSNLQVQDIKLSNELASLNSTIGQGVVVVMDSQPPISGGMRLFGEDSNLFVRDTAANITIGLARDELITLNGTMSDLISGDAQLYVRLDGSDDAVQIWGIDSTSLAPSAVYTVDNAAKVYVNNPITDYATETTSALIKAQTDKLSFYADAYGAFDLRTQVMNEIGVSVNNTPTVGLSGGTEIGLVAGTQVQLAAGAQVQLVSSEVGLITGSSVALATGSQVQLISSEVGLTAGTSVGLTAGASVDVNNFPAKQSVFVENTAEGFDINVNITNASVPISLSATADVSVQNSSLDVHCYGSSDGTTWHHIKTSATGEPQTHSQTRDGAGNSITSTAVSGTETYRGLDVVVKGSASVVNPSGSQLAVKAQQYGSYGNVANNVVSILPSGVTAGIDVSAWSYFVGAYEDYNGATVGDISLQYSFDNITYYTLFNTQIFPSGSSPRRANINKTDIPAVNYIRLRNGTSSTLTSVTLTLLGGSLS